MSTEKYEQTRTCENCSFEEIRLLDALTAAFEETRTWQEPCPQCGATEFSESCSMPAISREIFKVWATNDNLSFSQQDQDLLIASRDNLELILEFVDSPDTHIWQRRVLASSLYVLWYDSYPETSNLVEFVYTFTVLYDEQNSCESDSIIDEYEQSLAFDESNSCHFHEVNPEECHDAEFASQVAFEIHKRAALFVELGADKAEEFGEELWYIGDYMKEAFEKYVGK